MPNAFNFSASPFDCLTAHEQRLVRDHVDVAYFREGQTILDIGAAPTHLFVLIKGLVTQYEGDEVIATYGPDDCFDGRALVAGKASSRFVATEEVVTYELARQTVSDLIASNATFGALLFSDLGQKLTALSQRQSEHELQSLNLSRVDEAYVRPPIFVDAATDILSVVKVFQAQRSTNVLVQDNAQRPPRLGMFTATALQKAILHGTPLDRLPVGEMANYGLITVKADDHVGEALALMLRHDIHRVVVVRPDAAQAVSREAVVGVLESLDVFSFLSNHSHLIAMQVEAATSLDELEKAAAQITRMIARQQRSGTRVPLIAKLVQDLNAKIFQRAWQLIAPDELVRQSCLFVMGSEGRGEQLLKTDQDNGLIWRDGYAPDADQVAQVCERFSAALARFGYPECPGRIMVSNPAWRMAAGQFAEKARGWLLMPEGDSLMNLAIFMDAHAVCGDVTLLEQVRQGVMQLANDNDALLARYAAAIDAFGNSTGWWNRLLGDSSASMNIKKEGIFPLVHGIRSLAFAHRLHETGTAARIAALVQEGALSADMGHDLTESLSLFMGLRLKAGLAELEAGRVVSGAVDVARLSSLDRDLLKDALGVVKRFKALVRHRFRLDAL